MRVHRSAQILTVLTTLVALSACKSDSQASTPDTTVVAAAPAAAAATTTAGTTINVAWDSGPLDLAYHNERMAMDARHNQEIAHPRADESADKRAQRQSDENKDLEDRYAKGKTDHARVLPPSDRH